MKIYNMLRLNFIIILSIFISMNLRGQEPALSNIHAVNCTEIKSQGNTGTCWSFATVSYLESELIRSGIEPIDLSEMFVVRHVYFDKARNYMLRQGKANFSQGSLAHDVINVMRKHGVVPDFKYPGRTDSEVPYNHSELEKELKVYLDSIIKAEDINAYWLSDVNKILDKHLGPLSREVDGVQFANSLGLNADDYISITSFLHHPKYKSFVLEIPDNYSNGSYMNVELQDLKAIVDNALAMGSSVSWDGDVSEKGFDAKNGYAVLGDPQGADVFNEEYSEPAVTAAKRQNNFMKYNTTDDHLMHIVGKVEAANGKKYYKIKNSWGSVGPFEGYLYMSEAYFDMKTVGILVHKSTIPLMISELMK